MDFEFPDTGEGVTEGKFLKWEVEEGDPVEEDQVIAEVETDKAVIDVPAPADGIINKLLASPGDTVKVGEVIMKMDTDTDTADEIEQEKEVKETEESEDVETEEVEGTEGNKMKDEESDEEQEEVNTRGASDVKALPKVRKIAEEKGVDLESIKTDGRITEEDVKKASGGEIKEEKEENSTEKVEKSPDKEEKVEEVSTDYSEVKATPSVRKLAREKGIDLEEVEGTGRGGKILRGDVLAAAEGGERKQQETETADLEGEKDIQELSQLRKTVASRMEQSRFTAPHVTHVEKVDVTELAELRESAKDKVEEHLTYLPFIMKAAVKALKDYPNLNAEYDAENQQILRYGNYDLNIAVDTEKGLMTPLMEEVDEKSVVKLAGEIGDKAEKARNMELSPSELENGTFSITNLGAIGGEEFTPIINYPQVAILGIGKISETAEVIDGEIQPRMTVKLSLSYDHRVVDGAEAARFMNVIAENLENPNELLLNL